MGLIRKLKFNKKVDYLSMNKFTINSGSIIGGELKMLPVMRWYFAQSRNNPNIFYIDLTIKLKNYTDIIDGLPCIKYLSITSPSVLSTDSENNVRYYDPMPSIIGDYYHTAYTFDFCSDARADDVYTYGKLIEIIKLVNSEINKALYSKNEEDINSDIKNNNGKIFSAYEINEIITNAHRNYMDGMNYRCGITDANGNFIEGTPITKENVDEFFKKIYDSPFRDDELIKVLRKQFYDEP